MSPSRICWISTADMALMVDLYELTMADSYLRHGHNERATFDLFVRSLPPERAFLVVAGIEQALTYLERMRFDADARDYLAGLNLFSTRFLEYLASFRFSGDVWATPEGTINFPPAPLLTVTAPRVEAQIVETFLLNVINSQTMWASKAARIVLAAQGRAVVDFSPRRDHGADAALYVARASYLAGCVGTSNVLAGMRYGIPVYGTMAHAYVMSFLSELESFRAYACDFPHNTTLLVDTYDTLEGVQNAIVVGHEMAARGEQLRGIRLDSGDLVALSQAARQMLDEAGLPGVKILASGDLNEVKITDLLAHGARIDIFGVGTELGVSMDVPALGGVYKLVEDEAGYHIKLSAGKATLPGRKQVFRHARRDGRFAFDVISLADEAPPAAADSVQPLLVKVMENGRILRDTTLAEARQRAADQLAHLPREFHALSPSNHYPVFLSSGLAALRTRMYVEAGKPPPTEQAR
ncbi:MAG: nicotinate phosphoribosyltransferase [Ardenticatenaceae bacterium]|nr:nicotinate phosphoribosyltransferase [Ardenticatenaceae bacterium]HBY97388.1 nicotinate phosphoribosyltransferase [Chloroflexota bacterium]